MGNHCFDHPNRPPFPHPHHPGHMLPPPPHHPGCCHHGGKVKLLGRLVVTVKFIDSFGHTSLFDIEEGKVYIIKAISSTKGLCKFTGRIVDFDSVKGVEKILDPPHIVSIGSIIVDYSSDYGSNIIKINTENIVEIRPVTSVECCDDIRPGNCCDEYHVDDPFADKKFDEGIKELQDNYYENNSIDNF